jgi:AcrR family transcriptional regulator
MASGVRTKIQQLFEDAVKEGWMRPIDVRQTAISFLTMSLGYLMLAPFFDLAWDVSDRDGFLEERKRAVVDLIMNGVKVRLI